LRRKPILKPRRGVIRRLVLLAEAGWRPSIIGASKCQRRRKLRRASRALGISTRKLNVAHEGYGARRLPPMSSVQSSNLSVAGTNDLINQRQLRDLKRALSVFDDGTTREP